MSKTIDSRFYGRFYTCPYCNTNSQHDWFILAATSISDFENKLIPKLSSYYPDYSKYFLSVCISCEKTTIWNSETKKPIYPDLAPVPLPNDDLDEEIKKDYIEARSIFNKSPRGATALLRLCVQKLCQQLGTNGKDLNNNIGELVERGLPEKIQQALDIVRVIGNNAVHPGKLNIEDDINTAKSLFILINTIAEKLLTEPKRIQNSYNELPEQILGQIKKRDGGQR